MSFASPYVSFSDGTDPAAGQPQIDRLTAPASAGSLTITAGTYGTTGAIPWGPYANAPACCAAVAAALNAIVTGGGMAVAINTSGSGWSPSSWGLLIAVPIGLGRKAGRSTAAA